MENNLGQEYWKELEMEQPATRKCLERIPGDVFDYKPHEKSMVMSSLLNVIADIPRWIAYTIEKGEVDFATYPRFQPKTTSDVISHFDTTLAEAKNALANVSDEALEENFTLKNGGQVLMTSTKKESISSSINHLAHHRGQLTVYMRLNNIPVPSIYGPTADERTF